MRRLESARSLPCRLIVLIAATVAGSAAWAAAPPRQDSSDTIYDPNEFRTFRLTLSAADWGAIVNDPTGVGDTWQRADMTWDGEVGAVPGVGVKRSGRGTLGVVTPKPSLRISFNEFEFANPAGPGTPGRKWRGVNRLKLDGHVPEDQTLMRDRLAYWTYRQIGAPVPRACHAKLYVNGDYKGVYTLEEPIKKPFLKYRWNEDDGNLYDTFDTTGTTTYAWRGSDPLSYVRAPNDTATPTPWLAENNWPGGDFTDLVNLVYTVNPVSGLSPAQIRSAFEAGLINLDSLYSHLAANTVTGDYDGIVRWAPNGSNNHQWYHRADTNRLELIKWDPQETMGLRDQLSGFDSTTWSIWRNFSSVPAVSWIESDPVAGGAYRARIRQIVYGPWSPAAVTAQIDFIYAQIRDAVYADTLKGQYAPPPAGWAQNPPEGFDNGRWEAEVVELRAWIANRAAYLRSVVGPPTLPYVSVSAADAAASEPGVNTGTFIVARTGAASAPLTVSYTVAGTATSGSDYAPLSGSVTIPAGAPSATIVLTVLDDTLAEPDESVLLTLAGGASYAVGSPSSATVTISDDDSASPLLAGSWRLNEMAGTTAVDSSTNGNHATVAGGPMWTAGMYGGSLRLDGTDDYLDVPDSASLRVQELTLAAWVHPVARGRMFVIEKAINTGSWSSFRLELTDAGNVVFSVQRSGLAWPTWLTAATLPPNRWTHVAATFRASAFKASDAAVYIDGVPAATTFSANGYGSGFTIEHAGMSLILGRRQSAPTPGNYLNGMIDDVRIYATVLTALEVAAVFAAGEDSSGGAGPGGSDSGGSCGATGLEILAFWPIRRRRGRSLFLLA